MPPDRPGVADRQPAADFDLGFAEVVCYERVTIVVFRCGCRWVMWLDREPVTIPCEGHGR